MRRASRGTSAAFLVGLAALVGLSQLWSAPHPRADDSAQLAATLRDADVFLRGYNSRDHTSALRALEVERPPPLPKLQAAQQPVAAAAPPAALR